MKHRRRTGKKIAMHAVDKAQDNNTLQDIELETLAFDIERLQKMIDQLSPDIKSIKDRWSTACSQWTWKRGVVDAVDAYDDLSIRLDILSNTLDYMLDRRANKMKVKT